jgi:monoterpene epsilon-lactone hydrolase
MFFPDEGFQRAHTGYSKVASFSAEVAAITVRFLRLRKKFAREHSLALHLNRNRVGPARPSASMQRKFDISLSTRHGYEVYTVAPRSIPTAGNVIYLHGGAYVEDIHRWHWGFIARMVKRLGMTFTVPLYPLAPEHDCAAANAFVLGVYRDFLASHNQSQLLIMGDSAGGGLAMSLAMQAIEAGIPEPAGLVLLSPWLDVTTSDPLQHEIEKVDPLLMRSGLEAAGRWYAGALATDDPRVSPLYGQIAGLPPTLMFCGTHDILVTDARRLADRAEAEGADIEYHEEPRMMHVYPLMYFPESRKAQDIIARFVQEAIAKSQ